MQAAPLVVKGRISARDRQRIHRQTERIRLTHQRAMRASLKQAFRTQEEAILSIPEPTMDDVYGIVLRSVPMFTRIFEVTYVGVADDMYPLLDPLAGKSYAPAIVRKDQDETLYEIAIREWIRRECGEKIVEINQTTLNQVKRIYERTSNQIEFRDEVSKLFDNSITPYRSNAIARTETACATNRASVETMRSLDFRGTKVWMAVGDADTRDTHALIDGMRVDFDGIFEYTGLRGGLVRMECPLDSKYAAPPEEVVNCRCDVGFEL